MEKESKKSGHKGLIIFIIIFVFGCWLFSDDEEEVSTEPIVNIGKDKYTLMVYMCGSNLESEGGYASDDIEEMMESQLADEINLLIYTGGTTEWSNEAISGNRNQIFKLENKSLKLVHDNLGMKYISNPDTLTEFVSWAKLAYPADKYGLILWDHGGGAVNGFGYDENDPDEEESLTIDEIKSALDKAGQKLDFIGFDACLMANFETAYALKNNANYFIASEELEPGSGWEYKALLNQLSKNTSQETTDFGKVVVDSFIKSNDWFFGADATLSVIDLSKIDNVYYNTLNFMRDLKSQKFDTNQYNSVTKALKDAKAFADGEIDTVDLVDFSQKISVNSSAGLANAINDCVFYNKATSYVENSNGLSIYFPNEDLELYEKMIPIYRNIGFSDEYINIMNEYANIVAGGNRGVYRVNNKEYSTDENYEEYSWFDDLFVDTYQDYYEENEFDEDELEVTDKGDYFALHLTDEQWENIVSIGSSVWYDDGDGYIDLGVDSYFDTDESGDLKVEFDGTWIAINGQVVRYEVVDQTENYEKGKIPAVLNGEDVNLIVYWDEKHPDGEVVGYEPMYENNTTYLYGKGYNKINQGDEIEFIVDYYDYYGEFDDEYIYGDKIVVGNDGLKVSYEWVGDGECLIYYVLTDMYNNVYYTEPVIVY